MSAATDETARTREDLLAQVQAENRALQRQLAEREAELRITRDELQQTSSELLLSTLDLDARVAERTEALSASTARYDELVRRIPVGIYTLRFHADGTIRFEYVSTRMCAMLDLTEADALYDVETVFGRVHPADRPGLDAANRSAAQTLTPFRWEGRCRLPTATRWFRIESEPTPLAGGDSRWNGIIIDITERKLAEERLALAKEAAESASRAKSTFLASMSHEIRTPLNAILGFSQVLTRDPALTDRQRDSLATIQRSGEHLLTLINDVIDMARIEAGRMTVQASACDLGRLLREIEALFRPGARDRGLVLRVAAPVFPRLVSVDETRLRQVLLNLVDNAVKFTPAGSVTLRVEPVGVNRYCFSVSDTGVGIAPAELAPLFEPFHQTASGRQHQGGTGLGLVLCHQLVRLMGGELHVESRPGLGSRFAFTLTLLPVNAKRSTGFQPVPNWLEAGATLGLEAGQPVCRVLIVDDEPDNRAPLRALLEGLNPQPPVLELREAADGREAIALWETWQPRVVFMDMRMPVLSGEEATRAIKARLAARSASRGRDTRAPGTLVVALTASAINGDRTRFSACGCDAIARKPFIAEELFAILEQRVGLRFVRAPAAPAAAARLSPDAVAARLAARPADWRAGLQAAVELGDFGRIGTLLEQVPDPDPAFQATLTHWAYNYDLEAFTRALGGG
jgi:signal transduction histidine kinase/CheY-like chemotaxis protein